MMMRALAILFLSFSSLLAAEDPLNVITYNIRNDTSNDTGPRDYSSQETQIKSADLMLKRIKARAHQDAPFIVMGDLNATTRDPSVKHLLESGLLLDHGKTQMRSSNEWNAELVPGLRIGHLFTSPSIKIAELQVESNGDSAHHAVSDHHPARLSIRNSPPTDAAPSR